MATSIKTTIQSLKLRSGAEHELIRLMAAMKADADAAIAKGSLRVLVAAGGAAGTHTVTGLAVGDILDAVHDINTSTGVLVDVTPDLVSTTVTVANQINNTGGSTTTQLVVYYYTPYTATVSA